MATKKTSKSTSKKKATSSKKSPARASRKTAKKAGSQKKKSAPKKSAARRSGASASRSSATLDAPVSGSYMDQEFAEATASTSPAYASTSPSYGASTSIPEEGGGSLTRIVAIGVLVVVIGVLLVVKFWGDDSEDVADTGSPAIEEMAPPVAEPEQPAQPAPATEEDVAPATQPVPETTATAGSTYIVKSGDTLWKVAQETLGNGNQWQKIYDHNKLTSRSLTAGQKLEIPPK